MAVNPTSAVNTTTNAQLDAAKTALKMYLEAGGGVVMIHNAVGGTEYQCPYFVGLAGSQYYDHGANQPDAVARQRAPASHFARMHRWAATGSAAAGTSPCRRGVPQPSWKRARILLAARYA